MAGPLDRFRRRGPRPVKTPTVLQMEALECGAACLGAVLAHHGRWVPLEELRIACGVSRGGSRASDLLRAARGYGLTARGFKLEPAALRRMKPPLVLHWNFSHFLVLDGFLRGGRVRVNDPRSGPRTIDERELDESMTGVVLAFEPGPDFARGGRPPRLLRALRKRIAGSRTALAFIVLASLLLVVPGLVAPGFARAFIDRVLIAGQASWVWPLLAALGGAAVVVAVVTWLQQSYLLRLETKLAVEGSCRFLWHLLRLPIEFFHHRYVGDLGSRVEINDRLAQLLSRDVAANALGTVLIVFFGVVLVQYDVLLTLVGVTVVALNVAALRWVSRKRVDGNRRLLREQAKLTGTAMLGLEMIESLKATGSESDLFQRWAGYQAKVVNTRQELERLNRFFEAVPPLLAAVNAALILGIGGLRVVEGEMSLGVLVAFQMLMLAFIAPVQRLVSLGSRLQTAEGELLQLDDVQRFEPAPHTDFAAAEPVAGAPRLEGAVELARVTFGYSRLDPPLLREFDLRLAPGSRVALVGKTGSGKTTVARLVAGLLEPWSGEVRFDGRPRRELTRATLNHSLAVVDQDIFVFEGTVRDNLTLWDATIPLSRVIAAAEDACIHDDVTARAGGYDGPMAEGGANWSGGQLQRLEIARALAGDPSVLILDEATSALDPETERKIHDRLRRRGCACLIVAHRLSTIRDADEIIVLDDGEVVQRGRHDELIGRPGPYSRLITDE